MFAYALFGESYVHAFAYILAPGSGEPPASRYPSHRARLNVLSKVAETDGITLPGYDGLEFAPERGPGRGSFAIRMAEASVEAVIDALWATIVKLIKEGGVIRPTPSLASMHVREYQMGIPASRPACLGDIINAGWEQYLTLSSSGITPAALAERLDELNEMVLKTVEVLEYRHRTDGS